MQFFLLDVGTAVAALLGYLALVALRRHQAVLVATARPALSHAEIRAARELHYRGK